MNIADYITIALAFLVFVLILLEHRHKVLVGRLPEPAQADPVLWKWGIFYFNPIDPRIVVPKRIPSLGWTLNFAQPISYAFFVAVILTVFLIQVLQ